MFTTRFQTATRLSIATLALAGLALGVASAPSVDAAGIRNCVDISPAQSGRVSCYEDVWAGGTQVRMTFANQRFSGATPNDLDPFYVLAPQTGTPQGAPPNTFPHDHVVRDVPPRTMATTARSSRASSCCAAARASPAARASRRGPASAGRIRCRWRRPPTGTRSPRPVRSRRPPIRVRRADQPRAGRDHPRHGQRPLTPRPAPTLDRLDHPDLSPRSPPAGRDLAPPSSRPGRSIATSPT